MQTTAQTRQVLHTLFFSVNECDNLMKTTGKIVRLSLMYM